jgi:hypothetical protein
MKFFRRKQNAATPPVADVFSELRAQALGLTPEHLGGAVPTEAGMLALLMETGYQEAVATLVAVADGTTSLYFSNGGGFVGAGTHPTVAEASRSWLEAGRTLLPALSDVTEPPLPDVGMTQFVAVTHVGLRGAVAPDDDLGGTRHELSPLFHAAQEVITQIRLTQS